MTLTPHPLLVPWSTACTEPQCLYSTSIPLLPLWAVRPVQSLSACTVHLYLYSPYGPYGLYSTAIPLLPLWAVRPVQRLNDCTRVHFTFYFIRLRFKCDGTRAETRFRLSAKRTSPFKSAGGRQFSRLLAAEVCASAVAMLDTPCCEVVYRVLATHSIRQFPFHFPSRASPCAITFQLQSTNQLHR